MTAVTMAPGVMSGTFAWWVAAFAVPFLLVLAPVAIKRGRKFYAALMLAGVLAVGLAAADDDFILRKPPQCETASIWDAEYWIYGCLTWDLP
jgi:hypothetical protein